MQYRRKGCNSLIITTLKAHALHVYKYSMQYSRKEILVWLLESMRTCILDSNPNSCSLHYINLLQVYMDIACKLCNAEVKSPQTLLIKGKCNVAMTYIHNTDYMQYYMLLHIKITKK